MRTKNVVNEFRGDRRESEPFDLSLIAFGIESDHHFQRRSTCTDAPQVPQHLNVTCRHSVQQTTPRKMHVDLVSDAVQLRRQIIACRLDKESVRSAALRRPPVNLL